MAQKVVLTQVDPSLINIPPCIYEVEDVNGGKHGVLVFMGPTQDEVFEVKDNDGNVILDKNGKPKQERTFKVVVRSVTCSLSVLDNKPAGPRETSAAVEHYTNRYFPPPVSEEEVKKEEEKKAVVSRATREGQLSVYHEELRSCRRDSASYKNVLKKAEAKGFSKEEVVSGVLAEEPEGQAS